MRSAELNELKRQPPEQQQQPFRSEDVFSHVQVLVAEVADPCAVSAMRLCYSAQLVID